MEKRVKKLHHFTDNFPSSTSVHFNNLELPTRELFRTTLELIELLKPKVDLSHLDLATQTDRYGINNLLNILECNQKLLDDLKNELGHFNKLHHNVSSQNEKIWNEMSLILQRAAFGLVKQQLGGLNSFQSLFTILEARKYQKNIYKQSEPSNEVEPDDLLALPSATAERKQTVLKFHIIEQLTGAYQFISELNKSPAEITLSQPSTIQDSTFYRYTQSDKMLHEIWRTLDSVSPCHNSDLILQILLDSVYHNALIMGKVVGDMMYLQTIIIKMLFDMHTYNLQYQKITSDYLIE